MNVAKWVLLAILALPFAELAAFVAVAATIGFLGALALVVATSLFGGLLLRHAGGNHIARVKMALGDGNISALQADGTGSLVLLAGVLLLIPGFITDTVGALLLLAPLAAALRRGPPTRAPDGVVDLEPEQWHRVPDPSLPRRDSPWRQD
ncbi:MAG: FxsA family protein [Pseudolabrys sp.]